MYKAHNNKLITNMKRFFKDRLHSSARTNTLEVKIFRVCDIGLNIALVERNKRNLNKKYQSIRT